jgi:hypothetical protein|tara:strand:+ start:1007 stop:1585 length:579 start_codon:yes stop_codon:yes gene_type:complete
MKDFSRFMKETRSLASITGKRLGLVPDGHGGYHDKKTGEFTAKNVGGRLKFYNQNQVLGEPDPPQKRTANNQRPVSTQTRRPKTKNSVTTEELRVKYISGEIFSEGTYVENLKTNQIGKIVRRGTNHLICVTEDEEMFKAWIHDVREWTEVSGVPADQRLVGTDAHREYVMKMTDTKKIQNFINKYKAKRKH